MRLLLLLVGIASIVGISALVLPHGDLFNNFRPWVLVASVLLAIVTVVAKSRYWFVASALGLVVLNLGLIFLSVAVNPKTEFSARNTELKVISLNVWYRNNQLKKVVDYLRSEDADVVLLQEMHKRLKRRILPKLKHKYPYILTCNCQNQVLLSKQRWLKTGSQKFNSRQPALIWADFKGRGGARYRVMGVHAAYPVKPLLQARHFDWLTTKLPRTSEPLILAGDFNATPWSWMLVRFGWAQGLRRGGHFSFSWPSFLPLQVFLIDNVFVSAPLGVRSFAIGPDVGSDHRPVVAKISMP